MVLMMVTTASADEVMRHLVSVRGLCDFDDTHGHLGNKYTDHDHIYGAIMFGRHKWSMVCVFILP